MFKNHIRRGIALLNKERPGWEKKIALRNLDLSSGTYTIGNCGCVLAQTGLKFQTGKYYTWNPATGNYDRPCGSFLDEAEALGLHHAGRSEGTAAHGFNVSDEMAERAGGYNEAMTALTREWKAEIKRLRAEAAQ